MADDPDYSALIQQVVSGLQDIKASLTNSAVDTDFQQLNKLIGQWVQQQAAPATIPIAGGGTGATTAADARTNLGIGTAGTKAASDNTKATLASVVGTPTVGDIAVFADNAGSIESGGLLSSGTWTPSLRFGGASVGMTASASGTYNRIGSMVFCRFTITLTAKGTSVGVATLSGLPVASNADATNAGAGGMVVAYNNMAALSGVPLLQVGVSSSAVSLLLAGATGAGPISDTNFLDSATLSGSFSYFV